VCGNKGKSGFELSVMAHLNMGHVALNPSMSVGRGGRKKKERYWGIGVCLRRWEEERWEEKKINFFFLSLSLSLSLFPLSHSHHNISFSFLFPFPLVFFTLFSLFLFFSFFYFSSLFLILLKESKQCEKNEIFGALLDMKKN